MNEILDKLKYLDKILINIDYLSLELNKLQDLRILKFKGPIENFDNIKKILHLIRYLKSSIRNQISFNIINNNSYLDRHDAIKIYYMSNPPRLCNPSSTKLHIFKPDYKINFVNIKKEIDRVIKYIPKNKKLEIRTTIIDFNRYCSDYVNRSINKFVLDRMNKFKLQFQNYANVCNIDATC